MKLGKQGGGAGGAESPCVCVCAESEAGVWMGVVALGVGRGRCAEGGVGGWCYPVSAYQGFWRPGAGLTAVGASELRRRGRSQSWRRARDLDGAEGGLLPWAM
jgi:hypothetical protein